MFIPLQIVLIGIDPYRNIPNSMESQSINMNMAINSGFSH